MTLSIKKIINTELFIDRRATLFIVNVGNEMRTKARGVNIGAG